MANKNDILANLRVVAGGTKSISRSKYRNSSKRKFASSTVEEKFGSFTKARKAAGLLAI
jgi:hypothetical protein